ncbi:NACHT, LRR and PYD domains-containing protein 3-like isoform X2 [Alosa sapidissima]|uniref:NACHT, LRR and PYD domains-containing protein 3-like isoform X2 n=1 Tax=Alosa sapidissima TaxID=34773 RepID=UPI001C099E19|nr:NACHT, LRR and PYD domains-containing protein 3-like isoform X2 [Alosa sapidissima]
MEDPQHLLFCTLDELGEAQLKRFRTYLSERHVEGFEPIPRGQLEEADATDVAFKMKQTYGGEGSLKVTLNILRKMNLNDLADKLERDAATESENKDDDVIVPEIKEKHKKKMTERYDSIYECIEEKKNKTLLSKIYTELYITEGESEGVNTQHEVRRIEMQSKLQRTNESIINCNNIFQSLIVDEKIKTVITTGIAGIGKTVCVQKFILDWAEGTANQKIDFIFAFPFRQLNLIQNDLYSLHELLLDFHPALEEVTNPNMFNKSKIILIFDGLDESKLSLKGNREISDPLKSVSVDVLITNLIKGNLLPSALIWITSRPAAVKQIPSTYIDRWTEVQGFNDEQKAEYFRKKIKDEAEADKAITHIKRSKSLYIMCHIPVFCWILVTVLLKMVNHSSRLCLPQTLTEVYIYFLLIETNRKNQKYADGFEPDGHKLLECNSEIILKLSKLAYKELKKRNILFYEKDLKECGIDVNEPSLYSGMCTEFFKSEDVFIKHKVFCFVHLSIQEFLAAFFVFYSYVNKTKEAQNLFTAQGDEDTDTAIQGHISKTKAFFTNIARSLRGCFRGDLKAPSEDTRKLESGQLSMSAFLQTAVDRSVESEDGHLDLFLRFLLGISLESNQKRLQGLLTNIKSRPDSTKKIAQYVKEILSDDTKSTERCMNLLLCLLELKDDSLQQEIQQYMNSGKELSPAQCTTLAYIILVSEDAQDEFDLIKYKTTSEGRRRLLMVLRICRKAKLVGCDLGEDSCGILRSTLQSENSLLKELDLSGNPLGNSGVNVLSTGLSHTNCRVETLRLADCKLTSSACQPLATVLQSDDSHLKELDLTNNDLTDSGVKELCAALGHKNCKLEVLMLSGCLISHRSCEFLASALSSTNSNLTVLDLSYNYPGSGGIQLLSNSKLKINVDSCSEVRLKKGIKKYAGELTLDPNTAHKYLYVSKDMKMAKYVEEEQPYPDHSNRFDCYRQVLCTEPLHGRFYWEVEWKGFFVVGVAYQSLRRDGELDGCLLGYNKWSWCLECNFNEFTVMHNKKRFDVPAPNSEEYRIGVYLDWSAGTLSFYNHSFDSRNHLYTFHCTFTEPLYAAFGVCRDKSFIRLCQI